MKVGDYVRTDGETLNIQLISKVKKIISDDFIHTSNGCWSKENIIKSSPNIIDLIEIGDYVNGMIVHCVYAEDDEIVVGGLDVLIQDTLVTLRSNNIKTIVTKEQFKSMEYKL